MSDCQRTLVSGFHTIAGRIFQPIDTYPTYAPLQVFGDWLPEISQLVSTYLIPAMLFLVTLIVVKYSDRF